MSNDLILSTVTLLNANEANYSDTYENEVARFPVGADPLIKKTVERLAEWVESDERTLDGNDLWLLGSHLYRYLFGDSDSDADKAFQTTYRVFKKQQGSNPDLRLRLTLAFERDALDHAQLPWEFLVMSPGHDQDRSFFVASRDTELVLTRCILPTVPALDPPTPLRILVVLCSPGGEPDLETAEMSALLETIQKLHDGARVEVKVIKDNPCLSDVQEKLAENPGWHPDVFHFIGHGRPGVVAVRMEKEDYSRHLADNGDRSYEAAWIDNQSLIDLFPRAHRPRLVFLHACDSAVRPQDHRRDVVRDAAAGLTDVEGIHAIIAMRYPIVSDKAAAFAQRFYQAIGTGTPIDLAVALARKALAEVTGGSSWGRRQATPLLYLQTDEAVILEAPVANQGRERFDCPYEQIGKCPGGGFVVTGQRMCRICHNELVWCVSGHPNTLGDQECADCGVPLDVAQTDLQAARAGAVYRLAPGTTGGSAQVQTKGHDPGAGFG